MSKFNPIPREELTIGLEKDTLLTKRCRRFNPFYQLWGDSRRGVIFLKLRQDGCNKKTALAYCSKPICREDSTRFSNGPATCRNLKVKNHSLLTLNGWQFTDLMYDLGRRYYTSSEDFLKLDEFDDLLQKHFMANEEKIKGDFKKKIKNLTEFYAELNKKYNFSHLDKKQLFEKLQLMKTDLINPKRKKSEVDKLYIPCGKLKMKSLVKEALENENCVPNIIHDLSIFPKYNLKKSNSDEDEILIAPPKLDGKKEESENDLIKQVESIENITTPSLSRKATLSTVDVSSIPPIKISSIQKNPIDLKKFRDKANLFRNLEAQNKFINAITNEDDTFTEIKMDNKRKALLKNPATQILTSNFPSKSLIAAEFNRANYMYGNEEEKKMIDLSPTSLKTKSILKKRRTLKSIRMGFKPEDFETKIENIQKKNTVFSQNLKFRKKDVSFVVPENSTAKNKPFNSQSTGISSFSKTAEKPWMNKRKNLEAGDRKVKQVILNTDAIEKNTGNKEEKVEEKDTSFDEDDEIEKEIKFQKDIKIFVRNKISSMNSRRNSMNVDTNNVEEFWSGIKEMRKNDFSPKKKDKEKIEKTKNFKNFMNSTYQSFFKAGKPSSKTIISSKSTNGKTISSTKYNNFN